MPILALLFLFFPPQISLALEGYPDNGLNIVSNGLAKIKNDFCFPVLVSVNNNTYEVASKTEISLTFQTWSNWNWLPGKRAKIFEKTVRHPLASPKIPTYGPGLPPTHVGANKYGYDFSIAEGTTVFAMEGGVVIRVIEKYSEPHRDEMRKNESNNIEILHDDGTVARYTHLKKNSSKVKLCEKIKSGDEIALSGNTGFSLGPHLHVDILRPIDGNAYETIPLKFREK